MHITVNTGHNVPQEEPRSFADAILKVQGWIQAKGQAQYEESNDD